MLVTAANLPGEGLSDYFADTNTHFGGWYFIYANTAAVIDVTGGSIQGTVTSVGIPAGGYLAGYFPYLKLASGTVTAYRNTQATNGFDPAIND